MRAAASVALLLGACAPRAVPPPPAPAASPAATAASSRPPTAASSPVVSAPAPTTADSAPSTILFHTAAGPFEVAIEAAATPRRRALGLRLRRTLAAGQGMLYVFPRLEEHPFWMKQTLIPLDLIFLDGAGAVIAMLEQTRPNDETHLRVGVPSLRVIEVPGGTCAQHGIEVGTRVELRGPAATLVAAD